MDHFVIAKTPDQMMQAQGSLVDFMLQKVEAEKQLLAEKEENLEHAKKTKIRTSGWTREVRSAQERVRYYENALAALREGYAIIPDFPISVIAVRTSSLVANSVTLERWKRVPDIEPEHLPVGEGHYVAPEPELRRFERNNGEGKSSTSMVATTGRLMSVDFPLKAVKPQILSELNKALKDKIFDEIGIIPSYGANRRGSDPMLIGRIFCKNGSKPKNLSFLITWWIDTATL